jgi:poly-gamma-glutamate capsule biosynthesis protein CapA/YwtB (metallophosphatase superfamily)
MGFSLAVTGDSLLTRTISKINSARFIAVRSLICATDVAFTNLEFTVPNEPWIASPKANGIDMTMYVGNEPKVFDELKWFGFNLFSGANNHSVDYNYSGLVNTINELSQREMICAGIGYDLASAEEPKYLDTSQGRVAIIAAASTYTWGALASRRRGKFAGRPGINPFRFDIDYQLDQERMQMLKEIDQVLGTARLTDNNKQMGLLKEEDKYRFMNSYFTESKQSGITTRANQVDMERIARSIKGAGRQADFVIVTLHGHEGLGGDPHAVEPADFIKEAAHYWLDAGADAFIGHGPHLLRPMELYKGKPIFYSLGNFFFTIESIENLPAEAFDQHDLPDTATSADVHDLWTKKADGSDNVFMTKQEFWQTILPICRFNGKKVQEIELHPLTLANI